MCITYKACWVEGTLS
uniref:Uncharacterized protein n=1 Tax=Anguilla anguilla TaxID=7936 RepID=A0A0E9S688_ANGAN